MRLRGTLVLSVLAALASVPVASAEDGSRKRSKKDASQAKQDITKCVGVRTEARPIAYGYEHHVHIHNGCDKTVRCEVTTNSNPEVNTVTLIAGDTEDVVMSRGSPASEVTAHTKCSWSDDG